MPRVSFGMIVLNGMPFLEYNLRALYPFAHEIIVVEGACRAARAMATDEGHSTDGTQEALRLFKKEHDPEDKLIIVTGEDDGRPDGFWNEKDEMSQAYARRATGEWLWQVDYDEFYLEEDMRRVFEMLGSDSSISGASFPMRQFWGGFDYLQTGDWFLYHFTDVRRLFRWRPGYRYVSHRPPTVVDEGGRDLRAGHWLSHRRMRQAGIHMYHYSYVLPKQAREKVAYYANCQWTNEFRNIDQWFSERYMRLGEPFHVGEGCEYFTWLERYNGPHAVQIQTMRRDIECGLLKVELRRTDDIERLLARPSFMLGRWFVRTRLRVEEELWPRMVRVPLAAVRKVMKLAGLARLYKRHAWRIRDFRDWWHFIGTHGWRYRHIYGYHEISGWLSTKEAMALYDLSRHLPGDSPSVVEIGSWLGKSSMVLAKGLMKRPGGVVYCIDPFNADGDVDSKGAYLETAAKCPATLLDQFMANMRSNGVAAKIRPVVGYSHELAPSFVVQADLLFIDGNHEYAAVLRDYCDWSGHLKNGGIIALHDVEFDAQGEPAGIEDFTGPGIVASERIWNSAAWANVCRVDNLLWATKRG